MVTLGIDGLIAIAGANGMVSYSTAIGPGAEGLTCVVTLRFEDHDVTETVVKPKEVSVFSSTTRATVWRDWPARMLASYAVNQVIRKHFRDAVEAAERGLDGSDSSEEGEDGKA
jgi:hypothetical protein